MKAALGQIEERRYESALIEKGVPRERIRKYGFGFMGKEVLIGEMQTDAAENSILAEVKDLG